MQAFIDFIMNILNQIKDLVFDILNKTNAAE